ncbi:hypothetical protein L207DRAFT_631982 [Hyaloscypha variabilis F]|uniref:Uncharacterized protein n=1 Tax=Hyaloscypha variabilis (strain UAMH 11265 / GT02V1 / F) TaxID=1149755 RepID=A0A2J6RUF2_HYAVF|nr:hypothetical protein L207DRAFT_631982 [Hyaloscypha variabilis F]
MPQPSHHHGRHHKHGHGHGQRFSGSDNRHKRFDIESWFCCSCRQTFQSIALNDKCTNADCQHTRCASCSIDGDHTEPVGVQFPRSPSASSSNPLNSIALSKETIEKLAHIDQLKTDYRASFKELARKHEQGSFASASDSGKSVLDRYLQDLIQPSEFVFAWEWCILPFLVKIVPEYLGRGYAITVMRDPRKDSAQTICLMSKLKPTRTRRIMIACHVLDMIPRRFYKNTTFQFYQGRVEIAQRGTGKKHPDDVCEAKNPHFYLLPMMGDSIGPSTEECAATLGPCLKFGDQHFWLANLHVFIKLKRKETNAQQHLVLHPGLLDKNACGHLIVKSHVRFGTLYASSGNDLTTTRPSSHPFWKMFPDIPQVVTDWVLIDDYGHTEENEIGKQEPFLNTLRIPGPGRSDQYVTVTNHSPVLPEAKVHTTGRTSGHQSGQICEIPAYLDADASRRTTKPTREWYVEQPSWITDSEDSWLESGIGVPGDSGAPVIDSDTHSLYGQIWGRNKYWGPGPRVAYFTTVSDISEDIKEKCPQLTSTLELPQSCNRVRYLASELYCLECAHPEENATPHSSGEGSDEMSMMSVSSPSEFNSLFDDSSDINPLEHHSTDGNPPDLQDSDMISSDSDERMSTNSRDAQVSFSPMNLQEVGEEIDQFYDVTNDQFALEMGQFHDDSDYEFTVNDRPLSIHEDDSEEDDIGRSSTYKKIMHYSLPHNKVPSSWVMVHSKPKATTKTLSKAASKTMTQPSKETRSLLHSILKTTEFFQGLALT